MNYEQIGRNILQVLLKEKRILESKVRYESSNPDKSDLYIATLESKFKQVQYFLDEAQKLLTGNGCGGVLEPDQFESPDADV